PLRRAGRDIWWVLGAPAPPSGVAFPAMEFGLLGPLEVRDAAGAPVPVGGPRVAALLAMLALRAGQVVSTDRLIEGLWPETARPGRPMRCRAWWPSYADAYASPM